MDPISLTSTPPKTSGQNDNPSELAHINEEIYKKNKDLAERNKTLTLLRKIDEIILSKVTDIQQTAQQVANTIVDELEYKLVAILLLDKKDNTHMVFLMLLSYISCHTYSLPDLYKQSHLYNHTAIHAKNALRSACDNLRDNKQR